MDTRDSRHALLGKIVGNYKLISVLGHGGTGSVYLGERADRRYSAQVAVKLFHNSASLAGAAARFRAECEILASLNHTNIAQLLDAGATEDGQLYLIMEYVRGDSVDRYCDRAQLDVRARLELFLKVCAAVQCALHKNSVLHGDIKPANILVTTEGTPKLLDFGAAKRLDIGKGTALTHALTRRNTGLLTLKYASPEQILGGAITTASDVYSLGVVLYELLTGLEPYGVPSSASQLELERSICMDDPLRPSSAVRKAIRSVPSSIQVIAFDRGLTPERLRRRLRGDLDAILIQALRKESQHRYASVEQLTSDIRRYLANEAVRARRDTWLYYSRRFVQRNAVGIASAAAFVASVIGYALLLSSSDQAVAVARDRRNQERQRAEAISKFMENVFAGANPKLHFGREPTARTLLESAAVRIQSDELQLVDRALLSEGIGKSLRSFGEFDRADFYLQDSARMRRLLEASEGVHFGYCVDGSTLVLTEGESDCSNTDGDPVTTR